MKVLKFDSREEWLAARRGRVTGSTAGDLVCTTDPTKESIAKLLEEVGVPFNKYDRKEELAKLLTLEQRLRLVMEQPRKVQYYKILAERLAVAEEDDAPDGENEMDRGTRLEPEAIARLSAAIGQEIDTSLYIWEREDEHNIAISPDGVVSKKIAAEAKCLASWKHIKAYLEQKIPDEYEEQVIQYFVVNEDLEVLLFCFYDPRIGYGKDFFYLEIPRSAVQDKVDEYLAQQRYMLDEINGIVAELTF